MKTLIIVNGDMKSKQVLLEECKSSNRIICADGGANHAYNIGIIPDIIIGDLDSVDDKVLSYYTEKNVKIIKYPREKDYTDTELCVIKAVEEGTDEICIAAGIGDRIDHSLGNIGLLHIINNYNVNGYIIADGCSIYLCRDEIEIMGKAGDVLSIIPYSSDAEGLFSKGLKYPLNDTTISLGRPLGVSNELLNDSCNIKIKKGEIIVIKLS